MKNKKFGPALFFILLVSIFLFTLTFTGCKNFLKNSSISSKTSTNVTNSSISQETTVTSKEKMSLPSETVIDETTSGKNKDNSEYSGLAGFISKDAGFSIEYPSDVVAFSTNPYVNASGNPILLSVNITPTNEISVQTNGYDKETSLKDQEELKKGKFGESVDFSYDPSEKVIKIGDTFGKDFMVFGRDEVCDVVFERKLIFYNNGYRTILTLEMGKDEIIKSMPDLFGINKENCGDILTWKRSGDKTAQDDFYNALSAKTASKIAQQWYDTFDLIVKSLKLNLEIDTTALAVSFSNVRNSETSTESNYNIINSYPEFIKSQSIPENTAKDLNSAIANLVKPVEEQFIQDVISMGPPDPSDPRNYVNTYEGDYSLAYSDENLISMIYNVYNYTGGAHGGTWNLSLNYDLSKNKEIKLEDVFKPGFDYLKFISDFCINDLKEQILERGGLPDEAGIEEGAGTDINNFNTFVLTKNGIIIKFGQYQVASYAEGMFDVEISYSSFKDNINPESPVKKFIK